LDRGVTIDGGVTVAKMVHSLPSTWADCMAQGRIKFEKYFNHKVCDLNTGWSNKNRIPKHTVIFQLSFKQKLN